MGNQQTALSGIHPFRDPTELEARNNPPPPMIQFNPVSSEEDQAPQQLITISSGWIDHSSDVAPKFDEFFVVKAPTPPPRRPSYEVEPRKPKRTWRNLSLKTLISRPDLSKLGTLLKWGRKGKRRSQDVYPVPPDAEKPSPPSRPEVYHEQDEYFLVRWDPPAYDGGLPIIGYIIQHLELGLPESSSPHDTPVLSSLISPNTPDPYAPPTRDDTQCWYSSEPGQVSSTEVLLNNLIPGTTYQFRVIAENLLGYSVPGEVSTPIVFNPRGELDDWFSPPFIVVPLNETYNAIEHERLQLTVEIAGQPYPIVRWYDQHDMEVGKEPGGKYVTLSSGQKRTLTITGVECSHSGVIKCVGENEKGVVECSTRVLIEAPPHIRRINRNAQEADTGVAAEGGSEEDKWLKTSDQALAEGEMILQSGELAILKFAFTASPKPNICVYHESDLVDGQEPGGSKKVKTQRVTVEVMDNIITVKISSVERTDRGEWVVRLDNALGEDAAVVLVTIADRPSRTGKPDVLQLSDNTVILKWDRPQDDGGCPIQGYTVQYFRSEWGVWLKACTTKNPYTKIRDLIPGSKYKFRVRAENLYGVSDPSAESVELLITDVGSTLRSVEGDGTLLMKTVPEEEEEAVRIEEEEPGKAGTLKKGVASTKPTPQPRRKPGGSDRGIGYSISTAASTTSLTSRVSSGTMTDLSGITGRGFATGGGGGGNLRSIDITAGAHKYMSRPKRTEDDEPEIKFEPGDSGDFKNQLSLIASANLGFVFARDALMIFGEMAEEPPEPEEVEAPFAPASSSNGGAGTSGSANNNSHGAPASVAEAPEEPSEPCMSEEDRRLLTQRILNNSDDLFPIPPRLGVPGSAPAQVPPPTSVSPSPKSLISVSFQPQVIILPDDFDLDTDDVLKPPEIQPRRSPSPSPIAIQQPSRSPSPATYQQQQNQQPYQLAPFFQKLDRSPSPQPPVAGSPPTAAAQPPQPPPLSRFFENPEPEVSYRTLTMSQQELFKLSTQPLGSFSERVEDEDFFPLPSHSPVPPPRHHHGPATTTLQQPGPPSPSSPRRVPSPIPPTFEQPPSQQQQAQAQPPKKLYSRADIIRSAATSTISADYQSYDVSSDEPATSAASPPHDEEEEEDPELLKMKEALKEDDDHLFDDEDEEEEEEEFYDHSYEYDYEKLQQEYDEDKKRGMVSRQDSGVSGKSITRDESIEVAQQISRQESLAEAEEIEHDAAPAPVVPERAKSVQSEVTGGTGTQKSSDRNRRYGVVDPDFVATRDPFHSRAQSEVVVRGAGVSKTSGSAPEPEPRAKEPEAEAPQEPPPPARRHSPSPQPRPVPSPQPPAHQPVSRQSSTGSSTGGGLFLHDRFTDYIAMKASSRNKRVGSSLRSLSSSSRYSSAENVVGGSGSDRDRRGSGAGTTSSLSRGDSGRSSMQQYYSSSSRRTSSEQQSQHQQPGEPVHSSSSQSSSTSLNKFSPRKSFEKPPLKFREFDPNVERENIRRLEKSRSLGGGGSSSAVSNNVPNQRHVNVLSYDLVHPQEKQEQVTKAPPLPTTKTTTTAKSRRGGGYEGEQVEATDEKENKKTLPAAQSPDDRTNEFCDNQNGRVETGEVERTPPTLASKVNEKVKEETGPPASPPPAQEQLMQKQVQSAGGEESAPPPPTQQAPEKILSVGNLILNQLIEPEQPSEKLPDHPTPVTSQQREPQQIGDQSEPEELEDPIILDMSLASSSSPLPHQHPALLRRYSPRRSLPPDHPLPSHSDRSPRQFSTSPPRTTSADVKNQDQVTETTPPSLSSAPPPPPQFPSRFISTPDIYTLYKPQQFPPRNPLEHSRSETDFDTWIPDSALKQRAQSYLMAGGVGPEDDVTTEDEYSERRESSVCSSSSRGRGDGEFSAVSEEGEDQGPYAEQHQQQPPHAYGLDRDVPRERVDVRRRMVPAKNYDDTEEEFSMEELREEEEDLGEGEGEVTEEVARFEDVDLGADKVVEDEPVEHVQEEEQKEISKEVAGEVAVDLGQDQKVEDLGDLVAQEDEPTAEHRGYEVQGEEVAKNIVVEEKEEAQGLHGAAHKEEIEVTTVEEKEQEVTGCDAEKVTEEVEEAKVTTDQSEGLDQTTSIKQDTGELEKKDDGEEAGGQLGNYETTVEAEKVQLPEQEEVITSDAIAVEKEEQQLVSVEEQGGAENVTAEESKEELVEIPEQEGMAVAEEEAPIAAAVEETVLGTEKEEEKEIAGPNGGETEEVEKQVVAAADDNAAEEVLKEKEKGEEEDQEPREEEQEGEDVEEIYTDELPEQTDADVDEIYEDEEDEELLVVMDEEQAMAMREYYAENEDGELIEVYEYYPEEGGEEGEEEEEEYEVEGEEYEEEEEEEESEEEARERGTESTEQEREAVSEARTRVSESLERIMEEEASAAAAASSSSKNIENLLSKLDKFLQENEGDEEADGETEAVEELETGEEMVEVEGSKKIVLPEITTGQQELEDVGGELESKDHETLEGGIVEGKQEEQELQVTSQQPETTSVEPEGDVIGEKTEEPQPDEASGGAVVAENQTTDDVGKAAEEEATSEEIITQTTGEVAAEEVTVGAEEDRPRLCPEEEIGAVAEEAVKQDGTEKEEIQQERHVEKTVGEEEEEEESSEPKDETIQETEAVVQDHPDEGTTGGDAEELPTTTDAGAVGKPAGDRLAGVAEAPEVAGEEVGKVEGAEHVGVVDSAAPTIPVDQEIDQQEGLESTSEQPNSVPEVVDGKEEQRTNEQEPAFEDATFQDRGISVAAVPEVAVHDLADAVAINEEARSEVVAPQEPNDIEPTATAQLGSGNTDELKDEGVEKLLEPPPATSELVKVEVAERTATISVVDNDKIAVTEPGPTSVDPSICDEFVIPATDQPAASNDESTTILDSPPYESEIASKLIEASSSDVTEPTVATLQTQETTSELPLDSGATKEAEVIGKPTITLSPTPEEVVAPDESTPPPRSQSLPDQDTLTQELKDKTAVATPTPPPPPDDPHISTPQPISVSPPIFPSVSKLPGPRQVSTPLAAVKPQQQVPPVHHHHHHHHRLSTSSASSHERLLSLSPVMEESNHQNHHHPRSPPPTCMEPPSTYLPGMSVYYNVAARRPSGSSSAPTSRRTSRSSTPSLRDQLLEHTSNNQRLPQPSPRPRGVIPAFSPLQRTTAAEPSDRVDDDMVVGADTTPIDISEIKRRIVEEAARLSSEEARSIPEPPCDSDDDKIHPKRSKTSPASPPAQISPFMNYVFNLAFYLMLSPMLLFVDSLYLALLCLLLVASVHFFFIKFN